MQATRSMPTAARLVAALSLGALGWIASDLVRPLMPEGTARLRITFSAGHSAADVLALADAVIAAGIVKRAVAEAGT